MCSTIRIQCVTSTELRIDQHPDVLTPTDYALSFGRIVRSRELMGKNVLDVGCGSGILSIIAAMQGAHVWAVDIAPAALELTESNCRRNGVTLEAIIESNVLGALETLDKTTRPKFDLIICNNPSLPGRTGSQRTRRGYIEWNENGDGREILDTLLTIAKHYLTDTGSLLTHCSSEQGWNRTASLLSAHWPDWAIMMQMELSVEKEYYSKVIETWKASGSVYKKKGHWLHTVTIFEAFANEHEKSFDTSNKLLSERLVRELLDV